MRFDIEYNSNALLLSSRVPKAITNTKYQIKSGTNTNRYLFIRKYYPLRSSGKITFKNPFRT